MADSQVVKLPRARTHAPNKETIYSRYWKNYLPAAGEEIFGRGGYSVPFRGIITTLISLSVSLTGLAD